MGKPGRGFSAQGTLSRRPEAIRIAFEPPTENATQGYTKEERLSSPGVTADDEKPSSPLDRGSGPCGGPGSANQGVGGAG